MSDKQVTHDAATSRYVIQVGDQEAGFAAYVEKDNVRDFNHTVVNPDFQGQGLSKPLIGVALQESVDEGKKIRATCSAVQNFLSKDENAALREHVV